MPSGDHQHHDHDRRGDQVTVKEKARRGRRWPWRTRRYAQAEHRPADHPNEPASYSTGPGGAEQYHYHRTPTYHHQYADEVAASGQEGSPG